MIVVTKQKRSKEITTNLDSRQVFANKPLNNSGVRSPGATSLAANL